MNVKNTSGPVIEKAGELAGLLTSLEKGDVLFIDEIHRLQPTIEEYLYPAMEDYRLDIIIDQGPQARSLRLQLPKFTLIGATTRAGMVSAPLRSRFGMTARLDYYNAEEMQKIILRSAGLLGVEIDAKGAAEIATRARGTPRTANNFLRWVRDYVQVKADGKITAELADRALTMLEIDRDGFDQWDKRIIETLIHKFNGGPVGLNSLAVAIGEEAGTLEEVNEPYLIMEGYIKRTPQGRVAMPKCVSQTWVEAADWRASGIAVAALSSFVIPSEVEESLIIPRCSKRCLDYARHDSDRRSLSKSRKDPQRRGTDARDSRNARDEIRRGLGAGRSFELQTASVGSSIFHAQRSAGTNRLRDFSQRDGAIASAANRWRASPGLRQRLGLRSARPISAQRANRADAWSWFAPGKVRSAQAQTGSRRIVRCGAQTRVAKISRAYWDHHFAKWRGHPRYVKRLRRRAPGVHILISPVRVQGIGAAAEIATAIRELSAPNESWPPLDLIVLARGGGSIEDLWEFNEEIVARAIFHCAIPIVSAIGHEVDFTIADFVADLRAPTPSAAAELIVPDFAEVNRRIDELAACLHRCLRNFLSHQQTRLRFLSERALSRELVKRIRDAQQQIDFTRESLRRGARQRIGDARARLANFASLIKSRNPQREVIALRKGFADLRKRFGALAPRSLDQARQRFSRAWKEFLLRSDLKQRCAAATASRRTHTAKLCAPSNSLGQNENPHARKRRRI